MSSANASAEMSIRVFGRCNARDLSALIEEKTTRKIVQEHRSSGGRQRAISILLGLAVWRRGGRSSNAEVTVSSIIEQAVAPRGVRP